MKSPYTGQKMELTQEQKSIEFRKETFEIIFHSYRCKDSGELFTTTSLDELNMNQVHNQYRHRFNIPFPDEITQIRKKYGLSASKISEILGFGINSYRQYESGEMPSISNAKLIKMIDEPDYFIDMVKLCSTLEDKHKLKYLHKAKELLEEKKRNITAFNFKEYLLGYQLADVYSGYRIPNLEKFTEMVIYFSTTLQPYKTKMNKLLFYSDFAMFKESSFSISGMRYAAIDRGPVPNNFQSIFEYLANNNDISIRTTEFPQGYSGEQFTPQKSRPFNAELFTELELKVLEKVANIFESTSTNDIINTSHLEDAWIKNEKIKSLISYEFAFNLQL